jgi:hypothetical protein
MIPFAEKNSTLKVLQGVGNEYAVYSMKERSKFYMTTGQKLPPYVYRFPYLDVSFYKENKNEIFDIASANPPWKNYVFGKNMVFPLKKMPFERHWFYAPKMAGEILNSLHNLTQCVSNSYDHTHERHNRNMFTILCDELRPYFAMVNRTHLSNGTIEETLTLKSKVFHTVVYD